MSDDSNIYLSYNKLFHQMEITSPRFLIMWQWMMMMYWGLPDSPVQTGYISFFSPILL